MFSRLLDDKIIEKSVTAITSAVMGRQLRSPSFICRNIGRTSEWVGRMFGVGIASVIP